MRNLLLMGQRNDSRERIAIMLGGVAFALATLTVLGPAASTVLTGELFGPSMSQVSWLSMCMTVIMAATALRVREESPVPMGTLLPFAEQCIRRLEKVSLEIYVRLIQLTLIVGIALNEVPADAVHKIIAAMFPFWS